MKSKNDDQMDRIKWRASEKRPGYYVRTATRGGTTANVYKSIPTPEGQAQRELAKKNKAVKATGPVMKPGAWKFARAEK